jgi:hypothetical protein
MQTKIKKRAKPLWLFCGRGYKSLMTERWQSIGDTLVSLARYRLLIAQQITFARPFRQ